MDGTMYVYVRTTHYSWFGNENKVVSLQLILNELDMFTRTAINYLHQWADKEERKPWLDRKSISAFIKKYNLPSASSVQSAVKDYQNARKGYAIAGISLSYIYSLTLSPYSPIGESA